MNKIQDYLSRNQEEIATGILINLIQRVLDLIAAGIIYVIWAVLSKRWDFLGLEARMGTILTIIAYSILLIVVAAILRFTYSAIRRFIKNNTKRPKKEIIQELPKESPRLNQKEAAHQLINYAEDFRDRFKRMKSMQAYPDEQEKIINGEKIGLYISRMDNAHKAFDQLYKFFKDYEDDFDCRKELNDNIDEMWAIFKKYSETFGFWIDQKSLQERMQALDSLETTRNELFKEPFDKKLKRVDEIVETIHELLKWYLRIVYLSREERQRIMDAQERRKE